MSSWFKKPVNIAITVVVGLMFVGGIIALIWGVTRHTEPVFQDVCVWNDGVYYTTATNDTLSLDTDVNCSVVPGNTLWTKQDFPLRIAAYDPDNTPLTADHEAWRVIDQAIIDTNTQFGFQVFERNTEKAQVRIQWGVPYEANTPHGKAVGFVRHSYTTLLTQDLVPREDTSERHLEALVGMRAVASIRFAYIVLMHEFGHVIFLAHDDYTASVMYPVGNDDSTSFDSTNWTRFTDMDVASVQQSYAP